MEFSGIVTSIKLAPNPANNIYRVLADRPLDLRSKVLLELYDFVDVKIEPLQGHEDVPLAEVQVNGKATRGAYAKALKSAMAAAAPKKRGKRTDAKTAPDLSKTTKKMTPDLKKAAKRLIANLLTGSPVMVRFHNDCDGASGAVALFDSISEIESMVGSNSMHVLWQMNRSVAYTKDAFYSDTFVLNTYAAIEKPVVFITDFGTAQESEESISLAEGKRDFIWLDHHPIYAGFPKGKVGCYINPWDYGGDSDYTAGFLTGTFSELLAPIDASLMKRASLIGDYSSHAKRDEEDAKRVAIVLDYLTSGKNAPENLTPNYINALLKDRDRANETYIYASGLMNEAIEKGVESVRRYKSKLGVSVFMLDFKKVHSEAASYPLPGRYTSRLQEKMEEVNGAETVTVVHYGNYISIRMTRPVAERIDLLKLLEGVKESNSYVQSCGGHRAAASIRFDRDHVSEVADSLLTALGAQP